MLDLVRVISQVPFRSSGLALSVWDVKGFEILDKIIDPIAIFSFGVFYDIRTQYLV